MNQHENEYHCRFVADTGSENNVFSLWLVSQTSDEIVLVLKVMKILFLITIDFFATGAKPTAEMGYKLAVINFYMVVSPCTVNVCHLLVLPDVKG